MLYSGGDERQELNHHYGRAKKVLRALQTNLTNKRRTEEIHSIVSGNTQDVKVQPKVEDTNEVALRRCYGRSVLCLCHCFRPRLMPFQPFLIATLAIRKLSAPGPLMTKLGADRHTGPVCH